MSIRLLYTHYLIQMHAKTALLVLFYQEIASVTDHNRLTEQVSTKCATYSK